MSPSTDIEDLVAAVGRAPDDAAWREAFRRGFARLRAVLELHPDESTASATFESAAETARAVAVDSLPLGSALVMHLYPLCALRCVPLPWWSLANLRRTLLLAALDRGSLILANAGSERAAGAHAPVTLSRTRGGVFVSGTFDYMSLANVADIVLFSAPLSGSGCSVFCAADLRGESVHVGAPKFPGSMRLSDTCSVTFRNHRVSSDRCILIPNESALACMAQYQRSWFELLLGEVYLARVERLQEQWALPQLPRETADLNELVCMREYALRLLDDVESPGAVAALSRVTAAMKLRISWYAQSTAAALRELDTTSEIELGFFRRQPTPDERILLSIGAALDTRAGDRAAKALRPLAARSQARSQGFTTAAGSLTL